MSLPGVIIIAGAGRVAMDGRIRATPGRPPRHTVIRMRPVSGLMSADPSGSAGGRLPMLAAQWRNGRL